MVVKLFIQDPRGEITEIDLSDSEFQSYTVLQLKTKIREKLTTRESSQELIFKWCLLKDAAKLSDYGIKHESTIHLETQPVTKQLFIIDMCGRHHTFCLDEDEFKSCRVEQLKRRIQDQLGIPEDQQRLVYAGKQLEDGCTMFESGIGHESTIRLIVRPRMGLPDPEKADGGMGDKGGTNRIKIMGAAQTNTTEMVVKLFIQDPRGEITEIDLSDSEFQSYTVLQLKTKIREKLTTRESSQELIFKWWLLKDAAKLSDYRIKHESTIHFGTQPVKKQLFIIEERERPHTFCLDEDEFKSCLVEHLKHRIRDIWGIPEHLQRLVFQGRQLTDNRFLLDYGIQNNSTIYLILRRRGGGDCPEMGHGGMDDKGGKKRIKIMGAAQTNTTEMVVKLFIQDPRGEITEIDLSDSEFQSYTVLQLKTKIREKLTTRDSSQELIFKWCLLKDAAKLSDCGILHESTIQILNKHLTKKLNIKQLQGLTRTNTFCLDEDELKSCRVEHLKHRIRDIWGIPEFQQRLIFQGRQLTDNSFLLDYGIQNNSTIDFIHRLRGGGDCLMMGHGGMGDKGGKNRSMEHLYHF